LCDLKGEDLGHPQQLGLTATGMTMTVFHLVRMDLPEVRAMAELSPIDHLRQSGLSQSPGKRVHGGGHTHLHT
jgi:hypothetical protein